MDVTEATPDQGERTARILAEAFLDDPVMAWIFPDREGRADLLPGFLRGAFVERALATDRVLIAGDDLGAAAWVRIQEPDSPSDREADSGGAGAETRGADAAAEPDPPPAYLPYIERLVTIDALLRARHPSTPAHLWLAAIGVRPEARGSGVGSALLAHSLGSPTAPAAYLEASSERNRALYERFGFRAYGEAIQLPGGPSIYPMWRDGADRATSTDNATTKGTT